MEVRTKKQGINTMMSIVLGRRWNKLQDQQSIDKENIPPIIPTQAKKLVRVNKVPSLTQWGRWTSNVLEVAMDAVERRQLSLKIVSKFWHILSHPFQITWMGKQIKKARATRCAHNLGRWNTYGLDFGNASMRTFNHLATTQNESSRTNTNQAHPFQEWNFKEFLVVLVQASTSRAKYSTC